MMRTALKYFITLLIAVVMCMAIVTASAASYVLGDTDNDGEVTVIDATLAQRILAFMLDDPDKSMSHRADIDRNDNLDSADVTYILRYSALMRTPYPIGELVEDPTEPETQAPTEAVTEEPTNEPTQAPTEAPTQAPAQKPTAKPDPYELPPI